MNGRIRFIVLASVVIAAACWAGEDASPARLGIHWAKLSDRAQIQLIVDELQSAERSGKNNRHHLAPGAKLARAAQSDGLPSVGSGLPSSIAINGNDAVVQFSTREQIRLSKSNGRWRVAGGTIPRQAPSNGIDAFPINTQHGGVSVGETFSTVPVSREHHIDRLSRGVTESQISRTLFGVPEKTASLYRAHYMQTAPFISASYVQFVLDPEWNRILYGNLNRWIKSYTDVSGPSGIAVSPDGLVFVSEKGNQRISVLRLVGEENEMRLVPQFFIPNITNPTDIAFSDNGTPLDASDDFLYVADGVENHITRFALSSTGAVEVASFDNMETPTSIIIGRWNGFNTNYIYVVDKIGKRLRVFEDGGQAMTLVQEFQGDYSQYFQSIRVDHFGNLYVVDNVNSRILKFNPELELLDTHGDAGDFAAVGFVDIPFGKITIDGDGTYWAGFDQLFAVERWSASSGAQRRVLGLRLKNIAFQTDADVSRVQNDFVQTDAGEVGVRIFDDNNKPVRNLGSAWIVAGHKELLWDRRDDNGKLVPPGTYRYELGATSAYRDQPVLAATRIRLPLYYREDSGSEERNADPHLAQGRRVSWGSNPSETANEDLAAVQYRFTGLNPSGEYVVDAEYVSHDGIARLQDLTADGSRVNEPIEVSNQPRRTGYRVLPPESYADGSVTISVNRLGEGSAIISQLWLKQTGVEFSSEPLDGTIPSEYVLEQNYPNPFNPATVIRYALPQDGPVTLRVYSITGQEVATLVNETQMTGFHEVRFDAASNGKAIASGVYFYRLQAGQFSATRKFLLVK